MKKPSQTRPEQEIFHELAKLCASSGYIHAIAYFCNRDNTVCSSGEITPEIWRASSEKPLIRTEISTLIGLLLKDDIDDELPPPNVFQQYIDRTEALRNELHHAIFAPSLAGLNPKKIADPNHNRLASGAALREPIFYGGESAYSFQYRDFSPKKYTRDDEWLLTNKGFTIRAARDVVHALERMLNEKLAVAFDAMRKLPPDQWTFLPGYIFTAEEAAGFARLDVSLVEKVLAAFAVPEGERNAQFNALHDCNWANGAPLIPTKDGAYILLQFYSLVEALYESPFYWMCADRVYASTAMENRGLFTEGFSVECLARVFGEENVYPNIDIFESKGRKAGEIDVLVLFGNRAIILQAKSKRLTLEARKGNDRQIKGDFKKAIQDSCDQAYSCAKMLGDEKYALKDRDAKAISIPIPIKEVYVLCVVSDHYPALSFQARQFLKFKPADGISTPFVLDVFTLDAMTEMLASPLQLLSYIDRRTKYADKLSVVNELTALSFHLTQNLWLEEYDGKVWLGEDISADLDLAMQARREGIPAKRTPDGILTRFAATTLGRFIKEIEARPDPGTIEFGFMLLTLGEKTVVELSEGINEFAKRAWADGKGHDLTIPIEKADTGLTIHCNNDPVKIAEPTLGMHCVVRKYTERAQTWFGICVNPGDTSLRFGVNLDYTWERNDEMDALTKDMFKSGNTAKPGDPQALLKASTPGARKKIGRNEPCPCGSGKKYKKCCLP
uniref:Preprotein translocase subunit SecA (ATPase, RNA helicase) n=1 Tax=Candidatus Kentrum sp. UNK TaxID=2126344 RepID=A0A451ATR9_9GAMM|nr:MAG: Preprotein translocase subunit SecA (ATPase, RNA helicase) [Candidatus Kentron sp. UNK]VFK69433.1 MAG: Preprotein translocase subunit SecA (ATPase, RNA helicase) [Candidatus Kentron sp. UNK]